MNMFSPKKSEISNFLRVFQTKNDLKYWTKRKTLLNLYVFYEGATFHCIWRSGFDVICTLVSALKSNMAAHFHGNQPREIFFGLSPYFFILIIINIQWNDWVKKWPKQFLDQHPPPLKHFAYLNVSFCPDKVKWPYWNGADVQCLTWDIYFGLKQASWPLVRRRTHMICFWNSSMEKTGILSRSWACRYLSIKLVYKSWNDTRF